MAASFYGHVDIVRMLIDAEAKVNTKDKVRGFCTQRQTVHPITFL